jgi:hypothetical protein
MSVIHRKLNLARQMKLNPEAMKRVPTVFIFRGQEATEIEDLYGSTSSETQDPAT